MISSVGGFRDDLLGEGVGCGDGGCDDVVAAGGGLKWAALIAPGLAVGEHLKLDDLNFTDINLEFSLDATFMAAVG